MEKKVATNFDRTPKVDQIEVEIYQLYTINHKCQHGICKIDNCCCSRYEVCIDKNEIESIIDVLPLASEFSPYLKANSGYRNIFEEINKNLFTIDTIKNGICAFSYFSREKQILCSLHSAALKLDKPPHTLKPKSCVLWPLAVTFDLPINLSVDEDAFLFPCNKPLEVTGNLCPSISSSIKMVFGESFLKQLLRMSASIFEF